MTPNTFLWRFINSTTYTVTSFVVFAARFAFLAFCSARFACWYFFLICFFWKKKFPQSWFFLNRDYPQVFFEQRPLLPLSLLWIADAPLFLYGAFLRFCIIIRPVRFPNRKMLSAFCSVLCAASIPVFSCSVSLTFECALFNTVIPAISAAFFTGERWYISDWGLISFSNFQTGFSFFFFSS